MSKLLFYIYSRRQKFWLLFLFVFNKFAASLFLDIFVRCYYGWSIITSIS